MNRVVALMCCLLAFTTPAIAKLTSGFDYRVGILDADLVCIVSQKAPDVFKVDEVFLATGPAVEAIRIVKPSRSRAEIVRALRFLPLSRDLRQEFQYCNLGYLVAGHVVEALSGVSWEDFVRGRLLEPLGMGRTNLSVDEMLADDDHAADMTRWLLAHTRSPCTAAGSTGRRKRASGRPGPT